MLKLRPNTPLISPHDRYRRESLVLSIAAAVFVILSYWGQWFAPLDRLIYDTVLARSAAPMSDEVVIVAIDEQSLQDFGPWPWPRSRQAALLREVEAQQPQLIALDIIYSGFAPQTDTLVDAVAASKRIALPLMIDTLTAGGQNIEVLPVPELLTQNPILGHVQIERDIDAIVRGTHLYQGVGQPHWPHLMLALAEELGRQFSLPRCNSDPGLMEIRKCNPVNIPFAGPPGTYPQISASQFLRTGEASPALLQSAVRNKVVLIGVTAIGGGDVITTPLGSNTRPLSGVEFNANLLSALLLGTTISTVPILFVLTLAIGIALYACIALPRQSPKFALLTSVLLAAAPIALTAILLRGFWVYAPLATASITALLLYPVWSWRRHEIASSFIRTELDRIDEEERRWQIRSQSNAPKSGRMDALKSLLQADPNQPISDLQRPSTQATLGAAEQAVLNDHLFAHQTGELDELPAERLAAQIRRLENRARHLREGREIGLAGLERMQSGAIILNALGECRFINTTAVSMLRWKTTAPALEQLDALQPPLGQNWRDIWRACVLSKESASFESALKPHDGENKPVLVSAAPLEADVQLSYAPSWVVTISDLSEIRAAEAQREEALAFLSHDLRSPLSSILALLQSTGDTADRETLSEISRYTQRGLATSDQFLQLSRLQLQSHFERYPLDLEQVLQNSVEQVFFLARDKDITIHTQHDDIDAWVYGNGELLERALVNLLGNAIKYSERNTTIIARLQVDETHAEIAIIDEGLGIPEAEQSKIFQPFFRSEEPRLAQQRGSGLGLRFVKTVVDRHKGEISVASRWGHGTTFTLRLPLEKLSAEDR